MGDETENAEPTVQEVEQELIQCARYGEMEDMEEWYAGFGDKLDLNKTDEQGSSALHMAAANGHSNIVAWLLKKGAKSFPNGRGNTPLHWALLNKQLVAARMLLKYGEGVDVLEKDGLGKTAVMYAYDLNDAKLLNTVLEHPTANRLNKDGSVAPKGEMSDLQREEEGGADEESTESSSGDAKTSPPAVPNQQSMVSTVSLGETSFPIREIGFVSAVTSKLGSSEDDLKTTGAFLWAASLILAQWIASELTEDFTGKNVVELGAGCGLPGIAAFLCTKAQKVAVTDMDSPTFPNTEWNVAQNQVVSKAEDDKARELNAFGVDWCKPESWPESLLNETDIIIGSDLVYDRSLVEPLVATIERLLSPSGPRLFYYVSANTDRQGCSEFLKLLEKKGFRKEEFAVPAQYCTNVFVDTEDASFRLRFPEFENNTFTMYKFCAAR